MASAVVNNISNICFIENKASVLQELDRQKSQALSSACKKDNTPLKGIQITIQNLLKDIQNYDTIAELFGGGDPDREKFIQNILDIATGDIAGYMKTLLQGAKSYTFNYLSNEAKKRMPYLFPSELPDFTKKIEESNDLISCLFTKLTSQIPSLIGNALLGLLDTVLDVASCLIETFVFGILSGILDQITNAVQTAIGLFSGVVGAIQNAAQFIFDAIGFINGLLNFFSCESNPDCPTIQEINLGGSLGSNLQQLSLSFEGLSNSLSNTNNTNQTSTCDTGAKLCGPPLVSIFGGGGSGAIANPIVSPLSSSIIAFDIINKGQNYTSEPFAQLVDNCGNGSGSSLKVELENKQVKRIVVKSPGNGYLPVQDGSKGANGRVTEPPTNNLIPQNPAATYPVILEIDDIDIINPGFGYELGDKIIVTPDRGAVLEPVIDNGRIVKMKVINPGIGFDDFPIITTNSKTGYNLSSRPIFKVRRLDEEEQFIVPENVNVLSVVDCVGRINS